MTRTQAQRSVPLWHAAPLHPPTVVCRLFIFLVKFSSFRNETETIVIGKDTDFFSYPPNFSTNLCIFCEKSLKKGEVAHLYPEQKKRMAEQTEDSPTKQSPFARWGGYRHLFCPLNNFQQKSFSALNKLGGKSFSGLNKWGYPNGKVCF